MADEHIEQGDEGAEFLPDILQKPQNDIYTVLMGLTVAGFVVAIALAGYELYKFYDVKFFVLS
ncbi:MAG TPA: hypothetical protein VGK61_09045 [Planctomycetota bacterium]|jgi:hypothetical protein